MAGGRTRSSDFGLDPALAAGLDEEGDRIGERDVGRAFLLVVLIRHFGKDGISEPTSVIFEPKLFRQSSRDVRDLPLFMQADKSDDVLDAVCSAIARQMRFGLLSLPDLASAITTSNFPVAPSTSGW